jgi:hypothetical protein
MDPDGDPLTYTWSGCARGSSARTNCTIDRPGPVVASVEVRDDNGHVATGAISATGTNQPPGVQIGYVTLFPSGAIEMLGNVNDPDEGFLCGAQYCVTLATAGACRPLALRCTCLAGLEGNVARTATTGSCTVTFTLKDSWGEIGNPTFTFDVGNVGMSRH